MYGLVRPLYAPCLAVKPFVERYGKPLVRLVHPFGHSVYIFSFSFGIFESEVFIMKQMIIAVAAITAGAGAALLLLSRSFTGRTRKPCMTFAELYEDNIRDSIGGLFD